MNAPAEKKRRLLFYISAIAVAGGFLAAGYAYILPHNRTHTVTFTKDGFSPAELYIRAGERVMFVPAGDIPVWPASNPHPTHEIYSGFDAGEPLEPGSSWSFTFMKPGTWRYHDHINSSYEGIIHVMNFDINAILGNSEYSVESCRDEKNSQCWEELVRQSLREQGIDATFELFTYLYQTEPSFIQNGCHWVAHKLGEEAYSLYQQKTPIHFTPATTYCGYGFYHGFMQLLLQNDADVAKARDFCSYLERELGSERPEIRLNCYHGIGHGFIEDPPDPRLWGDANAMLKPAIAVCDHVSPNPTETLECREGGYNAVVLFMEAKKYGLSLDYDHLLDFCRTQEEKNRYACYYEFSQKLDKVADWDITRVPGIIAVIGDERTEQTAMTIAVAGMMQRDIQGSDQSRYITDCRSVPAHLVDACFAGAIMGFRAHGEPEQEYIKGLAFCKSKLMTESERDFCYQHLFRELRINYSERKMSDVCALVEPTYQNYCKNK